MGLMSPTYIRSKGFCYGWYANESGEPPHVHMFKGSDRTSSAKFWLKSDGIELANNKAGFSSKELRLGMETIEMNRIDLLAQWALFFQS